MNKDSALNLLHTNMQNANLRKHCYAVGIAMGGIYDYLSSQNKLEDRSLDRETWEVLGIIHDSDYEITKEDWNKHTLLTLDWIKDLGIDPTDHLYRAMQSHNAKRTGFAGPQTQMEWALECVDELTGFLVACTLVLPSKKIADLTLESVKKKWKQPAFAKGVIREQTDQVEEKLGIDFDTFVNVTLKSMQANAEVLGL